MMNVAGINSQIIFEGNVDANKHMFRREFLDTLAFELIDEHLRQRAINKNIPRDIGHRINQILGIEEKEEAQERSNRRGNCCKCKGRKRKTRYCCAKCKVYLCLEHSFVVCQDCCEKIQ